MVGKLTWEPKATHIALLQNAGFQTIGALAKKLEGKVPTVVVYRVFRESNHTYIFSQASIAARLGVSIESFSAAALDWTTQKFLAHIRQRMEIARVQSISDFSRDTGSARFSIRRMLNGDMEYSHLRTYRYIAHALDLSLDELLAELFNENQLNRLAQVRKISPMLELPKSQHKKIQISA